MSELADARQLQRLRYIDLCAYTLGMINRNLLMARFEIKQAWATKDISQYQLLADESLVYDHALRAYKPKAWFVPLYEHDVESVMQLLCEGKQDVVAEPVLAKNAYRYALTGVQPALAKISSVFRAMYLKKKAEVRYVSRTSGQSQRLIAPHSLIRTASFVYVRAFDHQSGEFRSFKLNRIIESQLVEQEVSPQQTQMSDNEWHTDVCVTLEANPDLDDKEAIEFDYGLTAGRLQVTIKKALLKFFMMDWNIAPPEFKQLPAMLFPLSVVSMTDTEHGHHERTSTNE